MKRFLAIILATFMLCSCAGCSDSNNNSDNTDSNLPEALKRRNEISYYTDDEVKTIIGENTKFNISEDFVSLVPKSVSYICSFERAAVNRQDTAEFYDDFKEMFAYLFPNEKFDDDYFFYYYLPDDEEKSNMKEDEYPIKNVRKYYDDAISGKNVISYYFYSPYAEWVEKDSSEITEQNIFLEFGSPIGNYLSNVNKGILANYYYADKGKKNNDWLETIEPLMRGEYEVVKTCSPECTDKYKLFDGKEISVADAVTFFENYLNNAPCPKLPVYDMKVTSVAVQQYDSDKYFYTFTTTPTYGGIPFDWTRFNLSSDSLLYESTLCDGTMVVTDDIDSFYGYTRTGSITDEKVTEELLPFDKAISKIEQSLTEQASFDILSADLVYTPLKYNGPYDIPLEEQKRKTTPEWKAVLYNHNDNMVYICYVDADTGENFRAEKALFIEDISEEE